jgi:hypothetical protein
LENILVLPGDTLVLQETQDEAIVRYFSQTIQFNIFPRFLNTNNAQSSVTFVGPQTLVVVRLLDED